MAYGVSFKDPWIKIDGDDYFDETLADGTQLRATATINDMVTGSTEYWGIVEDEEDEDD